MSILFDPSDMPPTGRVLRAGSEGLESCAGTQTLVSLEAAYKLHAQQQKPRRPGEDLYWTTDITAELPVRVTESGPGSLPPMTVVDYFADTVRRFPDSPALAFQPAPRGSGIAKRTSGNLAGYGNSSSSIDQGGRSSNTSTSSSSTSSSSSNSMNQLPASCFLTRLPPRASATAPGPPSYSVGPLPGWCMYTWQSYWSDICMCAKALLFVGSTRRTRVALMGVNSPGWSIPYFSSIFIDGVAVGIYSTNTAEATHHVVHHARCRVAFVDTLANAQKMLTVKRMQQQALEKKQQQQQEQQQQQLLNMHQRQHSRKKGKKAGGEVAARMKRSGAAVAPLIEVTGDQRSSKSRVRHSHSSSSQGKRSSSRKQHEDSLEFDASAMHSNSNGAREAEKAAAHLVEESGLDSAADEEEQQPTSGAAAGGKRVAAAATEAHRSLPFATAPFPPSLQRVQKAELSGSYPSRLRLSSLTGRAATAAAEDKEEQGACAMLQVIVVYAEEVTDEMREQGVMNFDDFLLLGEQVDDVLLTERMEAQRAGQCCSIVYTSGTTGEPKGVMLSHDNITWTAICSIQMMKIDHSHSLVSFLPLSHVAAQLVDLIMPVHMGCCVYFARPDALQGSLLQTLQAVRPTWFLAVPRVWEKIEQRLKAIAQARIAQIKGQRGGVNDAAPPASEAGARAGEILALRPAASDAATLRERFSAAVVDTGKAEGRTRRDKEESILATEMQPNERTSRRRRGAASTNGERRYSASSLLPSRTTQPLLPASANDGDAAPTQRARSSSYSSAAVLPPKRSLSPTAGVAGGQSDSNKSLFSRWSSLLSVASLKHSVAEMAKAIGYRGTTAMLEGRTTDIPTAFPLVMRLLLHPVRKALGLDRCIGLGSCAAPLAESTQTYFLSLGMPINSVYGLSETTGPQTFLLPAPGWYKVGSIGHSMPSTDVLVASEDSTGQGELCFRGRNVFMGYYRDATATQEALDKNAFLHTGDLGMVDEEGFVYITGRIKELIITAGGENVAPVLLERNLTQELSQLLSNCMVVGDRRRFLGVLVCLYTARGDSLAAPSTSELSPEVLRVIQPLGSSSKTLQEAQEDPIINALIKAAIERANSKTISRAQTIQGWRLLPSEFSIETGELTATLKLRRKVVEAKFADLIEQLYESPLPPCLLPTDSAMTTSQHDPTSCAVVLESPPHLESKL